MNYLRPGDALLIVDVQNDFLPGGTLAIPRGQEVIPALRRYLELFLDSNFPIFATRDWHPPAHCSFHAQGGPWPMHCLAQTHGAQFPSELQLPPSTIVISKGTDPAQEAYSGFHGSPLHERLLASGVTRLFVGGLATDYCVLETVKDARRLGYEVYLLVDAIQAVNILPEDGPHAEEAMVSAGAVPLRWEQLAA